MLCDQTHCGQLANSFGFLSTGTEVKACYTHSLLLLSQQVRLFDIAAYYFAQYPYDEIVYEQRQKTISRAYDNLTTLDAICQSDLRASLQLLTEAESALLLVVKKCFSSGSKS